MHVINLCMYYLLYKGMHIISTPPSREKHAVRPQPFTKDSRALFDVTMSLVQSSFRSTNPDDVRQWEEWNNKCIPPNDDAQQYISK